MEYNLHVVCCDTTDCAQVEDARAETCVALQRNGIKLAELLLFIFVYNAIETVQVLVNVTICLDRVRYDPVGWSRQCMTEPNNGHFS